MDVQARVVRTPGSCVLGVGTSRVVALLANLPGDAVPDLLQIVQRGTENHPRIAPDLQHALARLHAAALGPGGSNHMAVFGQTVVAHKLHDRRLVGAADLQHHAQLLVK